MNGASRPHRLELRTLLAALLVPALGAALGAAAFAYESAHQPWRPQTTRTANGWRIVEPTGHRPSDPAVGSGRLVWTWFADTILMDLTSGKTRLLGAGVHGGAVMPASISGDYVVFVEGAPGSPAAIYSYDISSGRRSRLPSDVEPRSAVVLAGDTALWIADRPQTSTYRDGEIRSYDLRTGRQTTIAAGPVFPPLLADGTLVAWSSTQPSFPSPQGYAVPSSLQVRDTATGTVTTVPPPPNDGPEGFSGWVALRDGKLLGLGTTSGPAAATVLVRDIATGATQAMGTAAPEALPAMDAATVVWVERDAGLFAASRIVGRHLDGSPSFEIARMNGAVGSLSVDGEWVAWTVQGLAKTWIETARLPR
jgi:hypothetical protein